MKVGDLVQSSAFEGQRGVIIGTDHEKDVDGSWYEVAWLSVNRHYSLNFNTSWDRREWCRSHEIELVDIP